MLVSRKYGTCTYTGIAHSQMWQVSIDIIQFPEILNAINASKFAAYED